MLGAVHLSDSNRAQPGTGHVPFERVVATLREAGFDGVLSVECRLRGEPADAVRECGAYLRSPRRLSAPERQPRLGREGVKRGVSCISVSPRASKSTFVL